MRKEKRSLSCADTGRKDVDDLINAALDEDQLKGSEAGKKIFQTNLYLMPEWDIW